MEIGALLDELHQAFLDRDLDRLGACFSADVQFEGPGTVLSSRADQVASEQAVLDAMVDLDMHVVSRVIAGRQVMEECVCTGRHVAPFVTPDGVIPPAGRTWSLKYMQVFDFADGVIARQHIYWDRAALLAQLAPAAASVAA